MPDYSVTRADLVGAAEAGHAGGAPAGEMKLAEDQDPSTYAKVGKRTQVPSFSTGQGPSLQEMKDNLVIIEIEEDVEEICDPRTGDVIDKIYHPSTRAIVPGDPDHPFVQGEEKCPKPLEKLASEMKSVPTEIAEATRELLDQMPPKDPPPASPTPPPMQQSPTSNGESALLASVLKLVDGLAQQQSNMMEMLLQSRQETPSPSPSIAPSPDSRPSSEASDSAPATSKESQSPSPQPSPSSPSESPILEERAMELEETTPVESPMPEAEVPVVWHTPHGQFSCKAYQVDASKKGGGVLVLVIYLKDQDHAFIPAASEDVLMLEVRGKGENVAHFKVQASGLDFDLELGGIGYKMVLLTGVE